MPPRLSIIIPSYARADLLERCLRSVTRFAPVDCEVLVIDDHSTNAIISRTASPFPNVRVHRLDRRSGFCLAANAGLALAQAPIVELLNDDTEVSPGWAESALHWFENPAIASVAPLVLQNDPQRQARQLPPLIDSAGDEYHPGGYASKRANGLEPTRLNTMPTLQQPGPVWGASASAAFYRRDAVLAVGGFPSDFGAYFEDVDLAFRLRRAGHECWFDPGSIVWHRVSASYGRRPGRKLLEQQSRNEERVFWRNTPGRERLRRLPLHAAVLVGKALRRCEEGTLAPWLSGRVRAWTGL